MYEYNRTEVLRALPPSRRRGGEHRHLCLRHSNRPGQRVGDRFDGRQDSGHGDGRQPVVLVKVVTWRVVPEVVSVEACKDAGWQDISKYVKGFAEIQIQICVVFLRGQRRDHANYQELM